MSCSKRLLSALDGMYGFSDKRFSGFKKIRQSFDEKTSQHVILVEYRISRVFKESREFGGAEHIGFLQYLREQAALITAPSE